MKASKKFFRRCVDAVKSIIHSKKGNLPKQREAEDICLMNFFTKRFRKAYYAPLYLLLTDFPGMRITGFEKKTRASNGAMKFPQQNLISKKDSMEPSKYFDFKGIKRLLEEMKKPEADEGLMDILYHRAPYLKPEHIKQVKLLISLLSKNRPDLKERFQQWEKEFIYFNKYGKYTVDVRSGYAVESIIAHSPRNIAVKIGVGHFSSMVLALAKIPHDKRPTVHFLELDCTNRNSFVTPVERMSAIVDTLIEDQKSESPK